MGVASLTETPAAHTRLATPTAFSRPSCLTVSSPLPAAQARGVALPTPIGDGFIRAPVVDPNLHFLQMGPAEAAARIDAPSPCGGKISA